MADGAQSSSTAASAGIHTRLQFGWSRRLPMLLQTEAAECGLACLAMVANYHGHDMDLASLRRRFVASLKGAERVNTFPTLVARFLCNNFG